MKVKRDSFLYNEYAGNMRYTWVTTKAEVMRCYHNAARTQCLPRIFHI